MQNYQLLLLPRVKEITTYINSLYLKYKFVGKNFTYLEDVSIQYTEFINNQVPKKIFGSTCFFQS